MDLVHFFQISLLTFLVSHLYIRYLKYLPKLRIFKGVFQEYYYCYACLGFWISLFFVLLFNPDIDNRILVAALSTISFLYNFDTSVLFSNIRENGILNISPTLVVLFLSLSVFVVSFYFKFLALALIFSFINVFYKRMYEIIWEENK